MKLQLLVIGCCVALAVSKPAEDACAAMRARLLPSLEPSARADAGALRACDADSDGAVDAAELVSCVQRAFGSTAHMDRAEVGERIRCFRSMMTDTALHGEQRQLTNTQQVRQLGSGSGSVSGLNCEDQNQFVQILVSIADGQLQAAYDALLDWYLDTISQSTGLLNGLLHNVSFILQLLLTGRSSESLVYMLTAFVRSADNALTAPVEDALISSLLAVSVGNFAAARFVIKVRLDAEVLNPATQDELQWIIEAFDAGSTADAVTRIISLLAGCPTGEAQSIYEQLMEVYDQLARNETANDLFFAVWNQIQETQPPPFSDTHLNFLETIASEFETRTSIKNLYYFILFLVNPCKLGIAFCNNLSYVIFALKDGKYDSTRIEILIDITESNPEFSEVLSYVQAANDAAKDNNTDDALDIFRNMVEMCVAKFEL